MNNRTLAYVMLCSLHLFASGCQDREATTAKKIKAAPQIAGEMYNCEDMISCINELRGLGKKEAVSALKKYIANNGLTGNPGEEDKLLLVCRLLFVNPNGWKVPRLGAPSPDIDWNIAKRFPVFPIAISDGVPFLLLSGYTFSGQTTDTGAACVRLCEGFSIIKTNIPESGYIKAARDLIQTDSFRRLYVKSADMERMSEAIRRQADGSNRWEKK